MFLHTPYSLEVREFILLEGDMREEKRTDDAVMKSHRIPPYALAGMKKPAQTMRYFLDRSTITYGKGTRENSDCVVV